MFTLRAIHELEQVWPCLFVFDVAHQEVVEIRVHVFLRKQVVCVCELHQNILLKVLPLAEFGETVEFSLLPQVNFCVGWVRSVPVLSTVQV